MPHFIAICLTEKRNHRFIRADRIYVQDIVARTDLPGITVFYGLRAYHILGVPLADIGAGH